MLTHAVIGSAVGSRRNHVGTLQDRNVREVKLFCGLNESRSVRPHFKKFVFHVVTHHVICFMYLQNTISLIVYQVSHSIYSSILLAKRGPRDSCVIQLLKVLMPGSDKIESHACVT